MLVAVAYLLAPALLFTGGFLATPLAVLATGCGLAAFALAPGWRAGWGVPGRTALACLPGGLGWAVLASGTHHQLYAAVDWQIRDAVLHDLASGAWPVVYTIGDLTWLLRAPLHYYLVPALAGPLLATAALFLWTALGLALVLMLLAALARAAAPGRRWAVPVTAAVFIGFGGLDLLPNLYLDGVRGPGIAAYWGRGGEWWAREFQYSGHATLLLWAPNHALPAWIPALLVLRHGRNAGYLGMAGLPLAAAAGWGPLSAAGAGVLAAVAALSGGGGAVRAALRGPANWLSLGIAAPTALFLTAGSSAIPHGPTVMLEGWGVLPVTALFLLVEVFAVAAAVLLLLRSRLLAASLVLLALLPLYEFGPGNEMTMRGGIAPLAVLAVAAAAALLRTRRSALRGALAALLAVGAAGQVMEASILANPPWAPSRGCTLPEAAEQSVFTDTDWSHYVVPWPEPGLLRLLAPAEGRDVDPGSLARCWPEAPRATEGADAP